MSKNVIDLVTRGVDQTKGMFRSVKAGFADLNKQVKRASTTAAEDFSSAFPAILTIAAIRQVGAAATAAIKPAADLQDAISQLNAFGVLGQGARSIRSEIKTFDEFRTAAVAAAQATGVEFGISTAELTQAVTELSKKGIEGADAIMAMRLAAKLAVVSNDPLEKQIDTLATLTTAWGFSADELAGKVDQLAFVAAKSRINFSELTDLITRSAAAVATKANPSFDSLIFLLARTRNTAQSAAVTGTQVRRAYEKFGESYQGIAAQLGVATTDMGGNLRDFGDVILDAAAKGKSLEDIGQIFASQGALGSRAAKPVQSLISVFKKDFADALDQNVDKVELARKRMKAFREEILMSRGALGDYARKVMEGNFTRQVNRARVAVEQLAEGIGLFLMPTLAHSAGAFANFVGWVGQALTRVNLLADEGDTLAWVVRKLVGGLSAFVGVIATFVVSAVFAKTTVFLWGAALKWVTAQAVTATAANMALKDTNNALSASFFRAAAGAGVFAKTLRFGMGLGKVGIFASVITAITVATSVWSLVADSVGSLKGDNAAKSVNKKIQGFIDAGDVLGAQFLQSALIIAEASKETPKILTGKLIDSVGPSVEKLIGMLSPEQGARLGRPLRDLANVAEKSAAEFADASLDDTVRVKARENLQSTLMDIALLGKNAALAAAAQGANTEQAQKDFKKLEDAATSFAQVSTAGAEILKRVMTPGGATLATGERATNVLAGLGGMQDAIIPLAMAKELEAAQKKLVASQKGKAVGPASAARSFDNQPGLLTAALFGSSDEGFAQEQREKSAQAAVARSFDKLNKTLTQTGIKATVTVGNAALLAAEGSKTINEDEARPPE